ncbi:transcriptional regulator with XRE-family HTH domain [Natronospira proteinivora]|uniref:Transcriptional regulator with XRE-family HTH domain n=1 Tax=Natronospira proteinivora TaxID=1807133 RepID=A0ABT1G6D3_9GAMM|nr:antitoxin Xre/MbcA/ParS toxin-binding domain-containing protein [Natronospira proteinivora]MCP1726849.1 transcriptional regulator with XRE-family HTH domain [Natronospira proteinivora]
MRESTLTQHSRSIGRAMPNAFQVAVRALKSWGFSNAEIARVLGLAPRSLSRYLSDGLSARAISPDLIERVSYVLGVEKALEILLGNEAAIRRWMNSPSYGPPFGGDTPKARLLGGLVADLYVTRRYLDGLRGGDFA